MPVMQRSQICSFVLMSEKTCSSVVNLDLDKLPRVCNPPVTAAAAATSGLASNVRAPGP